MVGKRSGKTRRSNPGEPQKVKISTFKGPKKGSPRRSKSWRIAVFLRLLWLISARASITKAHENLHDLKILTFYFLTYLHTSYHNITSAKPPKITGALSSGFWPPSTQIPRKLRCIRETFYLTIHGFPSSGRKD